MKMTNRGTLLSVHISSTKIGCYDIDTINSTLGCDGIITIITTQDSGVPYDYLDFEPEEPFLPSVRASCGTHKIRPNNGILSFTNVNAIYTFILSGDEWEVDEDDETFLH